MKFEYGNRKLQVWSMLRRMDLKIPEFLLECLWREWVSLECNLSLPDERQVMSVYWAESDFEEKK
jgi:hypothetical protein